MWQFIFISLGKHRLIQSTFETQAYHTRAFEWFTQFLFYQMQPKWFKKVSLFFELPSSTNPINPLHLCFHSLINCCLSLVLSAITWIQSVGDLFLYHNFFKLSNTNAPALLLPFAEYFFISFNVVHLCQTCLKSWIYSFNALWSIKGVFFLNDKFKPDMTWQQLNGICDDHFLINCLLMHRVNNFTFFPNLLALILPSHWSVRPYIHTSTQTHTQPFNRL